MRKRQEIRHLGLCLTARRRQLGPGGGSRRRAGVCGPRPVLLAGWSPWGGGTGPCCPQPFLRPPLQAPLWASPQSQQHVENTPRPHARPVSKFLGVGAESPGQPGPGASSPSDRWVTGHWSPQGRYPRQQREEGPESSAAAACQAWRFRRLQMLARPGPGLSAQLAQSFLEARKEGPACSSIPRWAIN